MTLFSRKLKIFSDVTVTILIWVYFILGFLFLFAPRYGWAWLRAGDREAAFQRLNQRFFSSFFRVMLRITPELDLRIQGDLSTIRSSIVISNHLSYLDPLLLVSLFEKQETIVKKTFFKVPIFSYLLRESGFIPATNGGDDSALMIRNCENIKAYLASGGNVFIFPEGTRSRTGGLGPFNKGAFSIARYCRAPIECLLIRRTNRLFLPGRFLFNTCVPNTIEVERIGSFSPDYRDPEFRLTALIREIHDLYEERLKEN
ncbi:MAG: 1-acyl-sn-glycerol-3-phosphate acyltransferase [Syntrophus sp. (in: bacteria)]|nr:1-acyl-sn-glycerol-3-phosphate acyltransferase [Syntrophus sp. (in: bacteria)]